MRVLIATDAWHPQVNGVVRTLVSIGGSSRAHGLDVRYLVPEGFPSLPVPTYPGLRVAIPARREIGRRIRDAGADAIHIATEGPIGHAVRAFCLRSRLSFTTCYATRFPEYLAARLPVPLDWTYSYLRRFHAAANATMVATPSLKEALARRGFCNLALWSRGVDTDLFKPDTAADLGLPRPIFLSAGRIAIEKNLEAFLSLDLPGSKVIVGDGPQEAMLKARFRDVHFLGRLEGATLAATMAAADVFVFPSLTDTFGLVQLEALACGVPVAAYPVTGPKDVIGGSPVGVLDTDLRRACLAALGLSRTECRTFALSRSWQHSAQQFMRNLVPARGTAAAQSLRSDGQWTSEPPREARA